MVSSYWDIDRCDRLSCNDFKANYVNKLRPVLISGFTHNWEAFKKWSPAYFKKIASHTKIPVKEFGISNGIKSSSWTMGQYADFLENYDKSNEKKKVDTPPPYCHDVPIFGLIQELVQDIQPFPLNYLPRWYWHAWWQYLQFFMGPSNSITPLHFDCLLTNNLFFQIIGRKRFTIIPAEDSEYCYRHAWRWFMVDPENPDFNKYPQYRKARPIEVIVNPGDILYLPPGTLHHVRSLDTSISFNIDWHTKRSSLKGLAAIFRGMPAQNVYYNFLSAAGLVFNIPSQIVFPFYKSYLNYVS
jgi:hypothetical protein